MRWPISGARASRPQRSRGSTHAGPSVCQNDIRYEGRKTSHLACGHPAHEAAPHPIPLPIEWGEGVRRTGERRSGYSSLQTAQSNSPFPIEALRPEWPRSGDSRVHSARSFRSRSSPRSIQSGVVPSQFTGLRVAICPAGACRDQNTFSRSTPADRCPACVCARSDPSARELCSWPEARHRRPPSPAILS